MGTLWKTQAKLISLTTPGNSAKNVKKCRKRCFWQIFTCFNIFFKSFLKLLLYNCTQSQALRNIFSKTVFQLCSGKEKSNFAYFPRKIMVARIFAFLSLKKKICFVKKCEIFEKKKMQIISFAANPTFNLCKSKMLDKTMYLFMKRLLNPVSH